MAIVKKYNELTKQYEVEYSQPSDPSLKAINQLAKRVSDLETKLSALTEQAKQFIHKTSYPTYS